MEGAPPLAQPLPGAAEESCPDYRRSIRGSRLPESVCPFLGCVERSRKMRDHVTLKHLHPVFRRSVPPVSVANLRHRILEWLACHLLGRGASLLELAGDVPASKVFRDPSAGVPLDLVETMDAICRHVGEEPPRRYPLFGRLHPAFVLHWRVQAHLVSRLGPRQRDTYSSVWSLETVDGYPLSRYGMSL